MADRSLKEYGICRFGALSLHQAHSPARGASPAFLSNNKLLKIIKT